MHDAQGVQLAEPTELTYVHGADDAQLLPALERALEGKAAGDTVQVQLEPEDAFGDYEAERVRVEPVSRYGEGLAPGMEVEEGGELYVVTDIAEGKAVLDGNHPLAGMALRFSVVILTVRSASEDEMRRGVSLP
jgi:FKBP-type peptidyl-prolyl cis-trans isomerase SlyD